MSYNILCKHIELATLDTGKEPIEQWYCNAGEIENYIGGCPEKCPHFKIKDT